MNNYIEIACRQTNHDGESICGDNFVWRKSDGGRTIAVLSDGMGHGVKANIMATYMSTMLLNFVSSHDDLREITGMILRMLPVCSVRKISYATFTIVDIDQTTGSVTMACHDSPLPLLLRSGAEVALDWSEVEVQGEAAAAGRTVSLKWTRFSPRTGDILLLFSDGITQSGQREGGYRFGWGAPMVSQFAAWLTETLPGIGPADMATQILSKASMNDAGRPADDMTCVGIHLRQPRRLMVVSCPPAVSEDNEKLLAEVTAFDGKKVVCGHPVAQIIADGMSLRMQRMDNSADPLTAPVYAIPGFELVTEGILVPGRLLEILEHEADDLRAGSMRSSGGKSFSVSGSGRVGSGNAVTDSRKGPFSATLRGVAGELYRLMAAHDDITFVIGMRREVDAGPERPDVFEMRRKMMARIAGLLSADPDKNVIVRYI